MNVSRYPGGHFDRHYVLAPFSQLLASCQSNALMGLRLVEKIDQFPPPTPEELQFLQPSLQATPAGLTSIEHSKARFKHWVLTNGFKDIHSCLKVALERLFVLRAISAELGQNPKLVVPDREAELITKASELRFPALIAAVNGFFPKPLDCTACVLSLNSARNVLVHTNGIVTERHCNTPGKDKLVVKGWRFKVFFKREDLEVSAQIGRPGPENAALMLGAEDFEIEFGKGQAIELSLKEFLDILNTCVRVRAEIDVKLSV